MTDSGHCTMSGSIFTVYPSEAVLHINVLEGHTAGSIRFAFGEPARTQFGWSSISPAFWGEQELSFLTLSFD